MSRPHNPPHPSGSAGEQQGRQVPFSATRDRLPGWRSQGGLQAAISLCLCFLLRALGPVVDPGTSWRSWLPSAGLASISAITIGRRVDAPGAWRAPPRPRRQTASAADRQGLRRAVRRGRELAGGQACKYAYSSIVLTITRNLAQAKRIRDRSRPLVSKEDPLKLAL